LRVSISDTGAAAAATQVEIHRKLSGEQRLLLALEMSQLARELCSARIRQDRPDWTESQVKRELLRLAFLPDPLPEGF